MKKILFLHGFFASGQCQPALALREAFEGRAEVISPDLPTHPKEALALIRDVIDCERPDVLVGNSCGSFYAQMAVPVVGTPALQGNPHFCMTEFLSARIGRHEYKSKRLDDKQEFIIDEPLITNFYATFLSCTGVFFRSNQIRLALQTHPPLGEDKVYMNFAILFHGSQSEKTHAKSPKTSLWRVFSYIHYAYAGI